MAPVALGQPAGGEIGRGVVPAVEARTGQVGRDRGLRVLDRERPRALGVAQLGLAHEDGAVGGTDEVDRVRQRAGVHEVGPGLAGQPVVPGDVGMAQGHRVGVGRGLVAGQRVVAAAEEVRFDVTLELVAVVGDVIGAEPETRELGVEVGVGIAAVRVRARHRNGAGHVEQAAGGAVGDAAVAGVGHHRVHLDEAAVGEGGPRVGRGHDGGALDRLLAGRQGGLGRLRGLDLADLFLGAADLGLLLLLCRQQQLHLSLQLGHAGLQRLFLCRLREGQARRDAGDEQRGGQRPPCHRCETCGHNPSRFGRMPWWHVPGRLAPMAPPRLFAIGRMGPEARENPLKKASSRDPVQWYAAGITTKV